MPRSGSAWPPANTSATTTSSRSGSRNSRKIPTAARVRLGKGSGTGRSTMDELLTRAQLVGYDPALAAIGTVVPRAEFAETAARGEFPATLLLDLDLDLDRVEAGDGGGAAHARGAVDWDKETLEELLASTEDESIALWFDQRELARAFDDVEAHGLRERAAVLAIAATAAAASASPALARTAPPMGAERGEQLTQQISAGQAQSTLGAGVQSMGTQRGE